MTLVWSDDVKHDNVFKQFFIANSRCHLLWFFNASYQRNAKFKRIKLVEDNICLRGVIISNTSAAYNEKFNYRRLKVYPNFMRIIFGVIPFPARS